MAHLKAVTQSGETPEVLSSVSRFDYPTFTYGELVPLMIELFDPGQRHITPLLAQLRYAVRLGAAMAISPSRGKRAHYGPTDLRRMLIAMELHHIGLSMRQAMEILNENESDRFFGATGVVTIPIGSHGSTISIDMGPLREAARKHLPHMFTGGAS